MNLIVDLLFPKTCFGCGRLGSYICTRCAKNLKAVENDVCPYCEKSSYFGLTHPACRRTHGLAGFFSFYHYSPLLQKIIKQIKYRYVRTALDDFLRQLPDKKISQLDRYSRFSGNLKLIPVPLYPKRHRMRGFNQSESIAEFFSTILHAKTEKKLVKRIKDTKSQAQLKNYKDRYNNLRGAFGLVKGYEGVKGSDFLIVDDVWTSGSTIKEVARVLRRAGAAQVFAITIAR